MGGGNRRRTEPSGPILMNQFAMGWPGAAEALGWAKAESKARPLGRAEIGGPSAQTVRHAILPAILATMQSRHARFPRRSILMTAIAGISSERGGGGGGGGGARLATVSDRGDDA